MRSGRKKILNITSRKKQDNMISLVQEPFGTPSVTPAPVVMTGDESYQFLWIASARDNVIAGTEPGVFQASQRTATTCFMRGLAERWDITTGSPAPWLHRRIVFSFTGPEIYTVTTPTNGVGALFAELSTGYTRDFPNLFGVVDPRTVQVQSQANDIIFKGTQGRDWTDLFQAKVDTNRVTLISDKVTRYTSGNDRGVFRTQKFWTPINKNLIYDDDENGNSTVNSPFSVSHGPTCGDIYVMDLFSAGLGSTSSDEMRINVQATLYWHER